MAHAAWRRRANDGQDPPRPARRFAIRRSIADRRADLDPAYPARRGEPTSIERARRDQLVRFYRDWYRPDLMAVVVVGDVEPKAVEAMIKEHFSPLTVPSPERPRPDFDVPDHPGTRYTVISDKETTA